MYKVKINYILVENLKQQHQKLFISLEQITNI